MVRLVERCEFGTCQSRRDLWPERQVANRNHAEIVFPASQPLIISLGLSDLALSCLLGCTGGGFTRLRDLGAWRFFMSSFAVIHVIHFANRWRRVLITEAGILD